MGNASQVHYDSSRTSRHFFVVAWKQKITSPNHCTKYDIISIFSASTIRMDHLRNSIARPSFGKSCTIQ